MSDVHGTNCHICGRWTKPNARYPVCECADDIARLRAERDRLQEFKGLVHKRLDEMCIPSNPGGMYSKGGCRIGDRLDIVEKERDQLRAEVERLRSVNAIIDRIRTVARDIGWAVGVHGSLVRDIDLIATPWTAASVPYQDFYTALIERVPLVDQEGTGLGKRRAAHGRIYAFAHQPGFSRVMDGNPKGTWAPPAIDMSIVDPREALARVGDLKSILRDAIEWGVSSNGFDSTKCAQTTKKIQAALGEGGG